MTAMHPSERSSPSSIWGCRSSSRRRVMERVCTRLETEYGKPRLGNPTDPLDDLIYIILSNRTSPNAAVQAYGTLKARFPSWDELARARLRELRGLLRPIGLSAVRSRHIREALRRIHTDFGECDLTPLRQWEDVAAQDYLTSLPGVSEKVAKCVMLYALARNVLPVDTHVHRVASRLGWTDRKRADQCHAELEALIPPGRRYAFHVDCIMHGRTICGPHKPKCSECVVSADCRYFHAFGEAEDGKTSGN
jgi:endonuclease III